MKSFSCEHCGESEDRQAPRKCDHCGAAMCFDCTERHDEERRCPLTPTGLRDPGPRSTPDPKSKPITPETYERLLVALERVYPGKWRRSVDVMPVAVCKTIDNEADALETIRRVEEKTGPVPPGLPSDPALSDMIGTAVAVAAKKKKEKKSEKRCKCGAPRIAHLPISCKSVTAAAHPNGCRRYRRPTKKRSLA